MGMKGIEIFQERFAAPELILNASQTSPAGQPIIMHTQNSQNYYSSKIRSPYLQHASKPTTATLSDREAAHIHRELTVQDRLDLNLKGF